MRLDAKKFFLAFFFFLFILATLGYYHFNREKELINHTINTTLQRAVESAKITIGEKYHERILVQIPTEIEDADMIHALTALANAQGVEYIYSLIEDENGTLRFTSSSARQQEISSGNNLTHFYDIYPKNSEMTKALRDNKIILDLKEETDQWGKFRSLYLPGTTSSGKRFIIGADIEVKSVQTLSNAAAFKAISTSLLTLLAALPFLLIYRNALKNLNNLLHERVVDATDELREVNEILETKIEETTQQLISQSFEDRLTGLPNRHRLQYDMSKHKYTVLAIVNIHNFKEINDFFGFTIGDDLLRQMGQWLQALNLNPYRLSGDEFVLLMDDDWTQASLQTLFDRLINRLVNHPFSVGEESISLSVTIGVDMGDDICLSHADIALHKAKETTHTIGFYDQSSHVEEQYQNNIQYAAIIHKALNSGRIICFYQPIVSIKSGVIEKYETLVRMIDESANIIPPNDFLKIAQKTRLYPQITKTVIEHACNTFQERREDFSVNLSIRDILDPATVRFIEETIVETNTAHRIVFEILESEGIDNFNEVANFILKMKMLGARIAIDDYGTGYSNLENILKLQIDYLKIDGSLIQNIHTDPKHAVIVKYIADFATKLGIETIAEYVENEEIYNFVKEAGITYSQGYFSGKPQTLSV